MLYPPPSNVENHLIGHKSETDQPKPKKIFIHDNIFLHLSAKFELKIQNTHHYRKHVHFLTSYKSPLNGPANGPMVTHLKIQNRLSRAP